MDRRGGTDPTDHGIGRIGRIGPIGRIERRARSVVSGFVVQSSQQVLPSAGMPDRAWDGWVGVLLRGDVGRLVPWIVGGGVVRWWVLVGIVVLGTGAYGAAVGSWRGEWQPLYTAVKLPAILLLTAAGNALLNGLLAPLLGVPLTLRQSSFAILSSFAVSALILGAGAPVVAFQLANIPGTDAAWEARGRAFDTLKITQVVLIAFAGVAGNLRLYRLLEHLAGDARRARRVLFGWLGGNFLLGTQLTWIFRPYFGVHALPVEFLRPDPLRGNFFETLLNSAGNLLPP